MTIQKIIVILIIAMLVLSGLSFLVKDNPVLSGSSAWQRTTYTAGDGTAYQAIYAYPATLERVIIGETVATGTMSILDAVSPESSPVFLNFGVGLTKGVYEIGVDFDYGIMTTVSSSANPVFIYTPK